MMPTETWLIEEARPLDEEDVEQLTRELPSPDEGPGWRAGQVAAPTLAVCVQDVIIHNNRKWFGEADIRLDALVVTGYGQENDLQSFYMPKTLSFPRVKDGDRLPTGKEGLLVFHGSASHFLDIMLMVSRDRKDTDDLATLLSGKLQSKEVQSAIGALLGLAVAAPHVAVVTAAIGAAAVLGNFAYQVLRSATGATIGLYHGTLLQYRDGFGIGPHPEKGTYRANDLSFRYEVVLEEASEG